MDSCSVFWWDAIWKWKFQYHAETQIHFSKKVPWNRHWFFITSRNYIWQTKKKSDYILNSMNVRAHPWIKWWFCMVEQSDDTCSYPWKLLYRWNDGYQRLCVRPASAVSDFCLKHISNIFFHLWYDCLRTSSPHHNPGKPTPLVLLSEIKK